MKKLALILALAMGTATTTAATGCYGSFGLTKKLHRWNGGVGNKWVNWIVFLGLNIVPVYGLFIIADAFILNTVEFFTGSHPVGGSASLQYAPHDDGSITIAREDAVIRLIPVGDDDLAVYRDGERVGTAHILPDGSVRVLDLDGAELRALSVTEMGQALAPSSP